MLVVVGNLSVGCAFGGSHGKDAVAVQPFFWCCNWLGIRMASPKEKSNRIMRLTGCGRRLT
jgi:hypothetical protein